jgi:uncharacterized membrane-anchored protein
MSTTDRPVGVPGPTARVGLNKVPEITAYFWLAKVLTTGMGEATSDYATDRIGWPIATGLAGLGLVLALAAQFRTRRCVTGVYWLAVVMVSVFGTMAADAVHAFLDLPFWASTTCYALVTMAVFGTWYAVEKTLSIHSITTWRREAFYWATVLATFALGTAVGDWTASTLKMGYLTAGIMFAVIIVVPAVAHRWFGLAAVPAFWFAYVITRPLGASFADWFGFPRWDHGLDFGTGTVSLVSTIVIVGLVSYLAFTGNPSGRDQN